MFCAQLKRFAYSRAEDGTDLCTKDMHPVVNSPLVVLPGVFGETSQYQLSSVIVHEGKSLDTGHFMALVEVSVIISGLCFSITCITFPFVWLFFT